MKTVIATIVLSTLSALSFADASQFPVPAGQLTRAEVIARIGTPSPASFLGEVTLFAEPATSRLTRAQLIADVTSARAARRGHGESNTLRFARATDEASPTRREVMASSASTDSDLSFR